MGLAELFSSHLDPGTDEGYCDTVCTRESNKYQGGRGGKRADHLARNRQQKTDMHGPFSTTFTGTVTNHSGITTISREKYVKLVEDGASNGMFFEQGISQETAYLTRLVKTGASAVIEKVVA
jgi:hypothetical protein